MLGNSKSFFEKIDENRAIQKLETDHKIKRLQDFFGTLRGLDEAERQADLRFEIWCRIDEITNGRAREKSATFRSSMADEQQREEADNRLILMIILLFWDSLSQEQQQYYSFQKGGDEDEYKFDTASC
jgi:hypothetical protein